MKRKRILTIVFVVLVFWILNRSLPACTNYLVSKGASAEGSTMITYSADTHEMYGFLEFRPAAVYPPGTMMRVHDWDSGKYLGQIKQARRTYGVVGLMNEHQVAMGETTFGGREELRNETGIMDYGSLMFIALQRAKTAREAIQVMGDLVAEYGYYSEGESFSVSDPNEVWIMEMIGKGKKHKGAVWVARRVPDGYICAHANQARIRRFPLNDPQNCLYAKDVISFAREKGYFKGADRDFSFADTYAPLDFGALRFCEARVWSVFRRAAPSLKLPMDYVKAVEGAEPLPLWIKPDRKLSLRDVMELMRDHFEGSDFDLTKGIGAGPYKLPYRWRPLGWKVGKVEYCNDRSVSTQQTLFSFVTQSRSGLPDPIGGVFWFGVDDTYSTVYVPMYCGIREIPKCFAEGTGSLYDFTWDSAFWVFNWVANYAYSRYSDMIRDIQVVQGQLEGGFLARQPAVEQAASALYKQAPELAREYLTKYSLKQADMTVERWRKLGQELLVKYLDGNVKTKNRKVTHPGYPEEWYKRIAEESGDLYKKKKLKGEEEEKKH